jgi:hypothetical protein
MSILSGDIFEDLTPDALIENYWEYSPQHKCYFKMLYDTTPRNHFDADTTYSTNNNGGIGKPVGRLMYMDFVYTNWPKAVVMCIKRIRGSLEDEYRFRWMMWLEDVMNINTNNDDIYPSDTARSNDMLKIITDVGELQAQQMDWADKVKTEYGIPETCILPSLTSLYANLYWLFK